MFVRRITQETPGVPGTSEVSDRFADRPALGPRDDDGRPCAGFGDSLVYVPGTGPAVFSPPCGRLCFYDLGLNVIRTVTALRAPWDAEPAASADGRVAALGGDHATGEADLVKTATGDLFNKAVEG
ncbi:hypothetical protein [Nonomuraea sp. NPDC049758]|uniref:hypothetical protein n=1 Tax=Nonomuraea sp. NPDC049758 TaxID=3154360 RepID=UPI003428E9EE